MSKNTPFRYDYVGSFLRPETLKKARRDFEEGKISKEELTKVEDDAILDLVEKQKKEQPGIWILCGDLMGWDMSRPRLGYHFTEKLQ